MRSGTVAYDPMGVALWACRRHFVAAASFSALLNLLYLAPTIYMLQIYDRVVPTQGRQTLLFLTLALVGALVTLSLLDRVRTRLLVRAGVTLDTMLVPTLMADTIGAGGRAVSHQALRDFDSLRQTLSGVGIIALFDAPWTPIYVAICFVVHPLLGAVALAGGLTLALLAWRNELATGPELERAQLASADNYAVQDAVFAGSEAVRALGMRSAMVGRMLRQRQTMLALQTSAALSASNYLALTKFFRLALQSVALGLGALLAIENQISAGAIFAAAFLIARALGPIEQLIGNWRSITRANSIYRSLRSSLTVDQPLVPTILPAPKGALAVEGVTVLSPTQDSVIIGDVSVSIAAGEVVAIIGPSGAGKSTLARVIAGAIAPTRGVVRIDGSDMADWDPEKLGRHIGYLPQDISLFGGTVKQNIARFRGEMDVSDVAAIDAAVIAATERAHARELIQRLPNGFDYELGTGGRGLSAGQAQRVALARAVFGDPAVIVLDEPNSHLDAEGDTALLAAIDHYKRLDRTVLIVSHKLGVLPIVDKLLVMRAGKVEIFGPRDEVLGRLSGSRPKPTSVVTASA